MRTWKWLFLLLGPALLALFIALMLMVAYPNALKLAAPSLCPEDKPDAFVVRYDVQTSDGTGTNFTLFCMSDRGEIEEVGTWEPLLVLFVVTAAIVYGLVFLLWLVGRIRKMAGGQVDPMMPPTDPLIMSADQILAPPAEDPFDALRDQQAPPSS